MVVEPTPLKNGGLRQRGWDDIPYMKWKIKFHGSKPPLSAFPSAGLAQGSERSPLASSKLRLSFHPHCWGWNWGPYQLTEVPTVGQQGALAARARSCTVPLNPSISLFKARFIPANRGACDKTRNTGPNRLALSQSNPLSCSAPENFEATPKPFDPQKEIIPFWFDVRPCGPISPAPSGLDGTRTTPGQLIIDVKMGKAHPARLCGARSFDPFGPPCCHFPGQATSVLLGKLKGDLPGPSWNLKLHVELPHWLRLFRFCFIQCHLPLQQQTLLIATAMWRATICRWISFAPATHAACVSQKVQKPSCGPGWPTWQLCLRPHCSSTAKVLALS